MCNNVTSEIDVLMSPNNWGMLDDSVVPSVSSTIHEYLAAAGSKMMPIADASNRVAARTRRRAADGDNDILVEPVVAQKALGFMVRFFKGRDDQ